MGYKTEKYDLNISILPETKDKKSMDYGARLPGLKFQLCLLLGL